MVAGFGSLTDLASASATLEAPSLATNRCIVMPRTPRSSGCGLVIPEIAGKQRAGPLRHSGKTSLKVEILRRIECRNTSTRSRRFEWIP
jgi:hypothetical protein